MVNREKKKYLSVHLSIDSIHPSIHPAIHLSIYPSIHLSICLSIYPSIHLSISPSIYPSIHLSICLSIHLSIYLRARSRCTNLRFLQWRSLTMPGRMSSTSTWDGSTGQGHPAYCALMPELNLIRMSLASSSRNTM